MKSCLSQVPKFEWVIHFLAGAGIALVLSQAFYDGDIWWHIAVGREMAQNGANPVYDQWSFTAPGVPYIYHSWLSGLLFYGVWQAAGEAGLETFHFLVHFSTCLLLYRLVRSRSNRQFALILACLMAFWLSSRAIRPQIFTPLFTIVLLGLIQNLNQLKFSHFLAAPLLFGLWVNLHGGFSLGLLLLGAVTAGCVIAYLFFNQMEKPAKSLFALSTLAFLATLVNPYGSAVYSSITLGLHHQSFDWLNISFLPLNIPWVSAMALLVSALFVAWYATYVINNKRWIGLPWLILGVSAYAVLITARRLEWLLFIPLWLLFQNFAAVRQDMALACPKFLRPLSLNWAPGLHAVAFYLALLGVFVPFVYAKSTDTQQSWYEGFPKEFDKHFTENRVTGNLFCPLTWSGKVTLLSEGRVKIYIDGRLQLYPTNFFSDYLDILHNRGLTASQIQTYGIAYLFLPLDLVDTFRAASAPILWKPVKVFDNAVLLKREMDEPRPQEAVFIKTQ